MYFQQFPKILYGFDKQDFKPVTDLMIRVKVRDKVLNEISLYNTYDVKNGETPENIAFKHFGDPALHWVILLTNNITDRFYEWPMTQPQFAEYLTDKYGAGNEDATHHYEITQSSGKTSSRDNSHLVECNSDEDGATEISNRDYEQRIQDKNRQIRLLDKAYLGQFVEEFELLIRD